MQSVNIMRLFAIVLLCWTALETHAQSFPRWSIGAKDYVYTFTFESQIGGKVLEGIGCVPDQTVLRKDHNGDFKPQLDAAIQYIQAY